MTSCFAFFAASKLVSLSTVDFVIIAFYFILVLIIGWYLRRQANTGEDFFLAGREMTAWIAGLSFLSANLGALELMGWAAAAHPISSSEPRFAARKLRPAIHAVMSRPAMKKSSPVRVYLLR